MKKSIVVFSLIAVSALIVFLIMGHTSDRDTTHIKENPTQQEPIAEAYFSGGCFWCVEAIYESVKGVKEAISGYSGGTTENPTYEMVGAGATDHAETVQVLYDPSIISFKQLVEVFFGSHDPTTLNRQGPDTGTQYRSIAFYSNLDEKNIITNYMDSLTKQKIYDQPIVTEVLPVGLFYKAEEYHQNYEENNPYNPYIRFVSQPRLNRFKENFNELLKEDNEDQP